MAETDTVACKFVVKETADGRSFLKIELLGKTPRPLTGLHLHFNFEDAPDIGEAEAIARRMSREISALSVTNYTSLNEVLPGDGDI
jgi:hypothetical protein